MSKINHNPDVLSCIANLSNDEVFTPPDVAGRMLDMLPQELWSNPDATFLDPACKSGVFLREIAKRLIAGLAGAIPDLQQRIDHIFTRQLFGMAITELTSLLSRRSVYCSKKADGAFSVAHFDTPHGNILFDRTEHTWHNGRCIFCGASKDVYDRDNRLETHAYRFIHTEKPQDLFKMKFDVIIGNPPYQLSDGGDTEERQRGGATPLYHYFIQQAKKLNPHFLIMIIPSRWFAGGRGLDDFRDEMLHDTHLKKLIDYPVSTECFPGVEIKGGVCYFLWDKMYNGNCEITTIRNNIRSTSLRPMLESGCNTFIRYNEAIPIFRKVSYQKEKTFNNIVSNQKPFGLRTFFTGRTIKYDNDVILYTNKDFGYVPRKDITQNDKWIDKFKVYITMAYGAGEDFPHQIINKPFLGKPNTCCTETYLVIGPFDSQQESENAISYIKTKFFRFLVLLKKNTQHASNKVYSLVPLQDFSEPWTDEKLYKKYGLTEEEIAFIDSMIRPME